MQCRFFEADMTKYGDMLPSPCGWRKQEGVTDFYKHLCSQERKKKRNRLCQWFFENVNAMSILVNGRNGISCAVFIAQLPCPSYISCSLSTGADA